MSSIRLLGAAFCAWALSMGCGGDEGDDGSGGSGGGTVMLPPGIRVVASNATPRMGGECMSSADCPGGGMGCSPTPSGYRVCTSQTAPTTMASSNPTRDLCDAARPCSAGACFTVPVFAAGICARGAPSTYNVCRSDECTMDSQCPEGSICGPAGLSSNETYGGGLIRQCIRSTCSSHGQCNKLAGGVCAVVQAGCDLATTGGDQEYIPAEIACVYPNGCTSISDCPGGAVCKVILGEGVCVTPA